LKLEKIDTEIEKVKTKISAYQARLKELERKKAEQENTEIVGLVRGVDMTPQELAEFIRSRKAKNEETEETVHEKAE
jgi:uncharacterized coiled-coil protein SlyX